MKRFYTITFNKKIEEDFLVDLIDSILKNLYQRGYFFFLDNVLIDNNKYYFIFGGNMKYTKILVKDITEYLKIQTHRFCY
mgnify:FL=1